MDSKENTIKSEQHSLCSLLKKYYTILIPIIQRDYAQGRSNEINVRKEFIKQLIKYIQSDTCYNDLDFIYGNVNADKTCFVPLDGQQRLTTLFLLHYYLSLREPSTYHDFCSRFGKEGKSRFKYETRFSSTAFLNALFQHYVNLKSLLSIGEIIGQTKVTEENVFSMTLKDFGWFVDSWALDPSVDAMMRMLDSIHFYFSKIPGNLYNRLVSEDKPAITFHMLPMEDNGLSEDLYIKMNSRGLPLKNFEKIKAKIIQCLSPITETRTLIRTADEISREKNASMKDYFSFKVDTEWAYMLWPYHTETKIKRNIGNEEKEFTGKEIDSVFLRILSAIAINYWAVHKGPEKLNRRLMDKADEVTWTDLEEMDSSFFIHLTDAFDAFEILLPLTQENLNDLSIDIKKLFGMFAKDTMPDRQYSERIQLYACYAFVITCMTDFKIKDEHAINEFYNWCRIAKNLAVNNRYDSEKDFCNAISSIDDLLIQSKEKGILYILENDIKFKDTGLDSRQVKEERIKSWLINRGFAKSVFKAEKNPYLTGQIISSINLSGLEDLFDQKAEIDQQNIMKFERISNILDEIFNERGLNNEFENEQLFRRALLACGDYTMYGNSNSSLLKNQDRDISWKRFLHQPGEKLLPLKSLIDCNFTNLKERLEQCIQDKEVQDLNDWYGMLVKTPMIWEELGWNDIGSSKFIRFAGNNREKIYLLKKQRMSGDHYELRSLYKYYEIKNKLIELNTFKLDVVSISGDECEPFIRLYNTNIQYCIYYSYDEKKPWRIELWRNDQSDLNEEIIRFAMNLGFEYNSSSDHTDNSSAHADMHITDEELIDKLYELIKITI